MKTRVQQPRRRKVRPASPGEVVAGIMDENGLTQTEVATRLGISRHAVSQLLHSERSLTPDMARRLGLLFGNGPELWVNLQKNVDLWDALHLDDAAYRRIQPLAVSPVT